MCTGISGWFLREAAGISEGTGEARQCRDSLPALAVETEDNRRHRRLLTHNANVDALRLHPQLWCASKLPSSLLSSCVQHFALPR